MSLADLASNIASGMTNLVSGVANSVSGTLGAGGYYNDSSQGVGGLDYYYDDNDYGYDYGYGYGGGGGGGGMSDEEKHDRTQAALTNAGTNYGRRGGDVTNITQDRTNDFNELAKNRVGDMSDIGVKQLGTINKQREANQSAAKESFRNANQQVGWQAAEQKKQNAIMASRNAMGNSAWGSALQDLAEGAIRYDDMSDVNILDTWKQNMNQIYGSLFQTDSAIAADYEDKVADLLDQFSTFRSDYGNEISELEAKYRDTMSDLESQYASTVSNIDSLAGTQENLDRARTSGDVSGGYGDDQYTLAKVDLTPKIDFDSGKVDVVPSDELQKMLVEQELMDSTNPLTKEYVRPDAGQAAGGNVNTSRAANSAFSDNLSAFRRV